MMAPNSCIALAALLLSFLCSSLVYSQTTAARPDRGLNSGGSYSVSDVENINLQNGNVQLSIPLASLPPIAGGKLSATLHATYNSKLWNVTRREYEGSAIPYQTYVVDTPQESDVAGWQINGAYSIFFREAREDFEYLIPPYDPNNIPEYERLTQYTWYKAVLRTPDGAEHELRPSGGNYVMYGGDSSHPRPYLWGYYGNIPNTIGSPMRYNTADGTHLSAILNPTGHASGIYWTLFLPDGTQVISYTSGIQRIRDTNGNSIKIFTDSNGTHYQDEQTGREIRVTYNPTGGSGFGQHQIWYHTVGGGNPQHIDINHGQTEVKGKIYNVQDWMPGQLGDPGTECTRHAELVQTLTVVREIVFPSTEPGVAGRKFTFGYNSDTTQTAVTPSLRRTCGEMPESYTRSASLGMGALNSMVTPSGAEVQYTYTQAGVHDFTGLNRDDISRETITAKKVIHDGITTEPLTTYDIPNQGNSTFSSMTNPDGSGVTQLFYPIDPNMARSFGSGEERAGLVYSTTNGLVQTHRHWVNHAANVATGSTNLLAMDPFVDAEYTTLVGTNLMSARIYQHDYNGNVTEVKEYDWFDATQVTRYPDGVPQGVPGSATLLRTTNTSYHNPAPTASSSNYYRLRTVTSGVPSILNATQEVTLGPGITQLIYDGQAFGVAPTLGNVTSQRVWDDSDSSWITSSQTYDSYGNVTTKTDARGKVTQFHYDDATHAAPTRVVVDPENGTGTQTATTVFDYYTGVVTSQKDANESNSTIDYTNQRLGSVDPFGRPGVTQGPLVNGQRHTVRTQYFDTARQVISASDLNSENDGLLKTRTTTDQLGRVILQEQTEDGTNYTIASQTIYNTQLRMTFTSNPHRTVAAESTDGWTRTKRDVFGRVVEVATFGGAALPSTGEAQNIPRWTGSVLSTYDANFVTVTDQAGKVRRSMTDGLGRLVRVDEPNAAGNLDGVNGVPVQPTVYTYDVFGNLKTVTQADPDLGTQLREFIYDSLSRLREARNPESGTIIYGYDDNGNLIRKTDARGVFIDHEYDALNRLKVKSASDGTPTEYHNYDTYANGKGRLSYIFVPGANSSMDVSGYDAAGRPLGRSQVFNNGSQWKPYQVSYEYDLAGNIKRVWYPSGRFVDYTVDNAGRTSTFSGNLGDGEQRTYSSGILYSPAGGMRKEQFGTDTPLYNKSFYNSRGQLAEIRVSSSYTGLTDISFNRGAIINHYSDQCWGACEGSAMSDNNGNLRKQEVYIPDNEQLPTTSYTMRWQQYEYDTLNRLRWAREVANSDELWKQAYSYDRFGNRTIDQVTTYGTGINKKEFTVNSANNRLGVPGSQQGVMTYDNAGNLINDTYSGVGYRTYDAENRMKTAWANNQEQVYTYDGEGHRVRRKVNGVEIWQVYGLGGELLAEYPANAAADAPTKEYGYRNGQLLITAAAAASASGGSWQDVTWSNAVGVSVSGNDLTKTAATGWANSGASSTQTIVSGDGFVEFTATETNSDRICGLSHGDTNQDWTDIDFGLHLRGDGLLAAVESGGYYLSSVAYAGGDLFQVSIESGIVKYKKNGVVFRTSSGTATYPLKVDTALYTNGATLTDVKVNTADGSSSTNVALAANGASASTSSELSSAFSGAKAIDGEQSGANWVDGGGWHGNPNTMPQWLEINFNGSKSIDEIDLFSLQDNYLSPVEPTESMTFTQYGVAGFEVQYWTGSGWVTIPGCSVSGNNKVWRRVNFPSITTTRIKVITNASPDSWTRIVELQAWGTPAPTMTNVALAANGGSATTSSELSTAFSGAKAIDGEQSGANWVYGGGWHGNPNTMPQWLEISFNGSKPISEIDLFSLQDNYLSPVEPTPAMTFTQYGLTAFNVEYWNGSSWATVPGGNITGNNQVWRKLAFAAITTNKIRVVTTGSPDGWTRITEVRAWSAQTAQTTNVTWTNAVGVSTSGNSLTKTVATGWANAGASSTQTINSGDGYVEFTASETTLARMCGLGNGDANQNYPDLEYAIQLTDSNGTNGIWIFESGTYRGYFGIYGAGDRFRVAVEGGVVKYYRIAGGNQTLLYSSTVQPSYPLLVDTSLYATGSTVTNVVISNGSGGGAGGSGSSTINWLVADQLGTPRMIFDQTGSLATTKRHDYLPFGEELFALVGGRTTTQGYTGDTLRQQFTAKERDNETGLDYFGARYFKSTQGRFTSPDEFWKDSQVGDPQSWNKYAYVRNNPLKYIDPTGEKADVTIVTDEEHKKGKITVKATIALWTNKGFSQKDLQKAAQEYKANIEKAWSGTYEQGGIKYEVTTTVDIQVHGSEQGATDSGAQNVLRVTEAGGHSGINPASVFGGPDTGEIALDAGTRNSEAAHEFTHMLGVGEHAGANVSNTKGALRAMSATAYDYGWAFGGAINEHTEGSRRAISSPCCPYPGVRLPAIRGQRQSGTSTRELGAPIKTGTGFDWWR